MVKKWAAILSVYIALLAVMPCCVFDNCPDDKTISKELVHNEHEQGDEDACGTCSPFFNCSTCSFSFIASSPASFDFTVSTATGELHSCYNSAIPENQSGKIWQPPKIG